MRRILGLFGTTISLLVAAAVVSAAPAQARNIGGSVPEGAICVTPGQATYGSLNSGPPCVCVILPDRSFALNVGKGDRAPCPPAIAGLP